MSDIAEIVLEEPRFLTPEEARSFTPSGDVVLVTVQTRSELLAEFAASRIKPSKKRPYAFGKCTLDFYKNGYWCRSMMTEIDTSESLNDLQRCGTTPSQSGKYSDLLVSDTPLRARAIKSATTIYEGRSPVWIRCSYTKLAD